MAVLFMNQELSQEMYNGPKITAEAAASLCDSSIRSSVEILDIGAGTGHVAEQVIHLQSFNYRKRTSGVMLPCSSHMM